MGISEYEPAIAVYGAMLTWISGLIISLLVIFLTLGGFHFIFFLFIKEKKANLYYSIFMFLSVISLYSGLILILGNSPDIAVKFNYYGNKLFAWFLLPVVIMLYEIFYEKKPKILWILIALTVLVTIFSFFGILKSVWGIAYPLIIAFEAFRVIVLAIIRRSPGVWIIGTGVISFFALFILALTIFAIYSIDAEPSIMNAIAGLLMLFSLISIPISMSIYLAWDFAKTHKNLKMQLETVKVLSERNIKQEQEKRLILEEHKEKLEATVKERTRELAEEKDKTLKLLLNTLPLRVVNELTSKGYSSPESYEDVTVFFSDIVGFTDTCAGLAPTVLINELNDIFTAFDEIIEKSQCERIKTIGDAYLAVCGLPNKNEQHAVMIANAALQIRDYLTKRNKTSEIKWLMRFGLHSGQVVGGIVGIKKYIYDVFGDTINTTSRIESNSEPMRINVSETTYRLISDHTLFSFIQREPIHIKGKGPMKMYFLDGIASE
jgi:adenylate cyclase